jgi:hypothetical protein
VSVRRRPQFGAGREAVQKGFLGLRALIAPALTHTDDCEIVAANLLDGNRHKMGERILGYALYVDPPLGRVGMTEPKRVVRDDVCSSRLGR